MTQPNTDQTPPTKTDLVAPPKGNTRLVAPKKKTVRMVKVFCLRGFKVESYVRDEHGKVLEDNSRMIEPGEIVDVTEKRGEELCREILGSYNFSGERYSKDGDTPRHKLTLCRRATKADLVVKKDEPLPVTEQEQWLEA